MNHEMEKKERKNENNETKELTKFLRPRDRKQLQGEENLFQKENVIRYTTKEYWWCNIVMCSHTN